MPSDALERMLAEDFGRARAALDHDGFAERIVARLTRRRRRRLAVIATAGILGGGLAATQFARIAGLFDPLSTLLPEEAGGGVLAMSLSPEFLAAMAILIAIAATAMVLQQER